MAIHLEWIPITSLYARCDRVDGRSLVFAILNLGARIAKDARFSCFVVEGPTELLGDMTPATLAQIEHKEIAQNQTREDCLTTAQQYAARWCKNVDN